MVPSDARPLIYLASPTYCGTLTTGAAAGAFSRPCRPSDERAVLTMPSMSSLLADGFNQQWCAALNMRAFQRVVYFAMLHADIEPDPFWLDTLIEELEAYSADVCSAVVPIKDDRGVTSTGVDDPSTRWTPLYRLTLSDLEGLPKTFSSADLGHPDKALLINSGCWVCRFDRPWVEEILTEPPFTIADRIVRRPDGQFYPQHESEDWYFSRWCHRRRLKVVATTAVGLSHVGERKFSNRGKWGAEKDIWCQQERDMLAGATIGKE